MMAEAALRLGVRIAVLDPLGKESPAGSVAELALEGSYTERDPIRWGPQVAVCLPALLPDLSAPLERAPCSSLGLLLIIALDCAATCRPYATS